MTRAEDTRVSALRGLTRRIPGIWNASKLRFGVLVRRHPVLIAVVLVTAVGTLALLFPVLRALHRADASLAQSHRALAGLQVQTRDQAQIIADVRSEAAQITRYLKQANPAGRERIQLECETINKRFGALGMILKAFRPPAADASLFSQLELVLNPTDCERIANIGPKTKALK